uniref:Uncharacterized protein n=1 Tax=Romanomermis culicivorax TaxID=13658 RepID=A0A915JE30_ROMCU
MLTRISEQLTLTVIRRCRGSVTDSVSTSASSWHMFCFESMRRGWSIRRTRLFDGSDLLSESINAACGNYANSTGTMPVQTVHIKMIEFTCFNCLINCRPLSISANAHSLKLRAQTSNVAH